eukprot:TRINITY_DN28802_c0_g1_i1.p1 TRINITY_DN28802_c0_g1~~TRINITY_DN28802_c0_g1_i1.p1  ORF type:complete len:596 (+),score=79.92 TRINITY_DN28802_c0_g1_i1:307-2094(+)
MRPCHLRRPSPSHTMLSMQSAMQLQQPTDSSGHWPSATVLSVTATTEPSAASVTSAAAQQAPSARESPPRAIPLSASATAAASMVRRPTRLGFSSRAPAACEAPLAGSAVRNAAMTARGRKAASGPRQVPAGRAGPCMEALLFELLQKLPAAARRRHLQESFDQAQRLALERWILKRRRGSSSSSGGSADESDSCDPHRAAAAVVPRKRARLEAAAPSTSRVLSAKRTGNVAACSSQKGAATEVSGDLQGACTYKKTGSKELRPIQGCQRHRRRGCLEGQRAAAQAGPFYVMTRYTTDAALAQRAIAAVLRIRERMQGCLRSTASKPPLASSSDSSADEELSRDELNDVIERRFRKALSEASLDDDLKLRFYILVSAKHWVGRCLNSPVYKMGKDGGRGLEAGLAAWRRLSAARETVYRGRSNRYHGLMQRHTKSELQDAWNTLKSTYVDVWEAAGHDAVTVSGRLRALEMRHRRHAGSAAVEYDSQRLPMRPPMGLKVEPQEAHHEGQAEDVAGSRLDEPWCVSPTKTVCASVFGRHRPRVKTTPTTVKAEGHGNKASSRQRKKRPSPSDAATCIPRADRLPGQIAKLLQKWTP